MTRADSSLSVVATRLVDADNPNCAYACAARLVITAPPNKSLGCFVATEHRGETVAETRLSSHAQITSGRDT